MLFLRGFFAGVSLDGDAMISASFDGGSLNLMIGFS